MREVRVVAAVIIEEGRVFAARRGPAQSRPGLWELPGGKVEPGETDAQAIVRELDEELGILVEPGGHLAENLHQYEDLAVRLVALRCSLLSGAEIIPREHDDVRWVDRDEIDSLEWAPADVPLLEAVREVLQAG